MASDFGKRVLGEVSEESLDEVGIIYFVEFVM